MSGSSNNVWSHFEPRNSNVVSKVANPENKSLSHCNVFWPSLLRKKRKKRKNCLRFILRRLNYSWLRYRCNFTFFLSFYAERKVKLEWSRAYVFWPSLLCKKLKESNTICWEQDFLTFSKEREREREIRKKEWKRDIRICHTKSKLCFFTQKTGSK